ncbi:MAG: AI-2E family transporter [Bradyrhizobium sp.]|uniref:AI-2E family transporter n=1 Tax=Bradyrhizobium sp. TaxID=376 RepID=UPI003C798E01
MSNVAEPRNVRTGPDDESDPSERRQLNIVSFAAALLSATIILGALYYGRDICVPLATAFLISFALNPPVTWLARRGLPRVAATALVMGVLLVVLSGLGFLLAAQVRTLAVELPAYQSTILRKLSDIREKLSAPGAFSGALQTIERVQKEVTSEPPTAQGPAAQRVEVVPTSQTPFEQAFAWLSRSLEPLTVAGIIFIFVFLALVDRTDLRDRLLRLLGSDVHRSTESMEEAGTRVSKYLLMQMTVNVSYGIPMALGLWLIGVPGALLWGCLAAVLRFVPYLGPLISSMFPVALAFATDAGWSMVLWTVTLIVVLELVSNNIVEPLLYGSSTGLSAISLITAAMFWTALWGPAGLILSTPLTVCLLVFGRNLPQLQFLDTLLGSTPALDLPTRIYQRLIASDPDEAIELANERIEASSLREFYNDVGIEVLRRASEDYLRNATAAHRLRFAMGMDALLDELMEEGPPKIEDRAKATVICIGGKWEVDAIAARIVAHALEFEGIAAEARPAATVNRHYVEQLALKGTETVCLSYFSENPVIPARHFTRRLRIRWPNLRIVLAFWNAPLELLEEATRERIGVEAVVNSVDEAVRRIHRIVAPEAARDAQQAEMPEHDEERVAALEATGLLDGNHREALDAMAKRAADVFNASIAVISTIDDQHEYFVGQSGDLPSALTDEAGALLPMARRDAICNYVVASEETLVVPDIERDPRFADNEAIRRWGVRFYAGSAVRSKDGFVLGAFCILDDEPRSLQEGEVELLEKMAAEVGATIADGAVTEPHTAAHSLPATATVGQRVPE